MILPVVAYGSPILRKKAVPVTPEYPNLAQLLADMQETMYFTNGVGLAAPQVNRSVSIFMLDSLQIFEHMDAEERSVYANDLGYKGVFINPKIESLEGNPWVYNEGCLSIPKVREDVLRPEIVKIAWLNEAFVPQEGIFNGITARIIQHEYDHLEGKLFIDYLSPLKRNLLKSKLLDISKGKTKMDYRLIHPK